MSAPPSQNGTLAYRVTQLEQALHDIRAELKEEKAKLDRMILSVVGAALTFTITIIVLAVTNNT